MEIRKADARRYGCIICGGSRTIEPSSQSPVPAFAVVAARLMHPFSVQGTPMELGAFVCKVRNYRGALSTVSALDYLQSGPHTVLTCRSTSTFPKYFFGNSITGR